jgi:hypothetical protein
MRLVELFGSYRFYYLRGWWYFSILQAVVIFLLGLKVFYDVFAGLGVAMVLFYIAAVLVVVIVPPVIGLVEFGRIGHIESQRAWEITPASAKLCREVDDLHKKLCPETHEEVKK